MLKFSRIPFIRVVWAWMHSANEENWQLVWELSGSLAKSVIE